MVVPGAFDPDGRVLDVLDMCPFAYVLVSGPDPVDLDLAISTEGHMRPPPAAEPDRPGAWAGRADRR